MKWHKVTLSEKELSDIKQKEKEITKVQLLKRLQCLKLKNNNWKNNDLSEFFWVCIDTITNWLKAYEKWWIEWLLKWHYKWKESKLTETQVNQLKKRNQEKPFEFAKEAKAYIEEEFGIVFTLHYIQKLLKKNFDCHIKKHD